jgi:hypothetical protein
LKPLAVRWASEAKWALRVKLLAGARLLLLVLLVLAAFAQLVLSGRGLGAPAQWIVCGAAALCVLPCVINAVAGVWLLSALDVAPGIRLVACGHSGRVSGYGLTRLELVTDPGDLVYLPYLAIATRPIVTSRRDATSSTKVSLSRHGWTEDMIQFVRQAAILAPYRALSSPVHVSRAEDVLTVQLSLARPASEMQMRRLLEAALARYVMEAEDGDESKRAGPTKEAAILLRGDPTLSQRGPR